MAMKSLNRIVLPSLFCLAINAAYADPGVMLGVTYNFDSPIDKNNVGLTVKVTSSDRQETGVVAAGISYFTWSGRSWGIDAGIGYNAKNSIVTFGYDFLASKPQLGVGYIDTSPGNRAELPDPSDIRLKRDIALLATMDDGMKIYSFKYLWSDVSFVGVMAQDLLANPAWASAVSRREDGFYVVNYAALGYRMTTLDQWREQGRQSIVRPEHEVALLGY